LRGHARTSFPAPHSRPGVLMRREPFPLLQFDAVWFAAAVSVINRGLA
jgi:hypothetical protein